VRRKNLTKTIRALLRNRFEGGRGGAPGLQLGGGPLLRDGSRDLEEPDHPGQQQAERHFIQGLSTAGMTELLFSCSLVQLEFE